MTRGRGAYPAGLKKNCNTYEKSVFMGILGLISPIYVPSITIMLLMRPSESIITVFRKYKKYVNICNAVT